MAFVDPQELQDDRRLLLHDMGWGNDWLRDNKVHPTDDEVYIRVGATLQPIGVHISVSLQRYRQARAGDVFSV